ncbi:MAG: glutathione binding-like protein [Hyphomicrobiales bacterium]|nr:glutathione binding-like protein [Hyphomicrobiales bacterium]
MIDLYTWSTPNGRKVSIMLEECELDYSVHPINIAMDEQHHPDFLKIAPNNRIPAIVDRDTGLSLMESGAILMYLSEKTGKFWPQDFDSKWRTVEWLMWQMGGVGPMIGQAHHFIKNNKGKSAYSEQRYLEECYRLYGVLDERLEGREYMVGDEYTIADIATWPWISRFEWHTVDMNEYPNVVRWYKAIAARPAVAKGYHVPVEQPGIPLP